MAEISLNSSPKFYKMTIRTNSVKDELEHFESQYNKTVKVQTFPLHFSSEHVRAVRWSLKKKPN